MIYLYLLLFLVLYLMKYIIKEEFFSESKLHKNINGQSYSNKIALQCLNIFIQTVNRKTQQQFRIYNIEHIKRFKSKMYIKVFIQHTQTNYVRLYFCEFKLRFSDKKMPKMTYYGEHGNNKLIDNGFNLNELNTYAEFKQYEYQ